MSTATVNAPESNANQVEVTAENAMRTLGRWPTQRFHVSHLATSEFKGDGLRPYVVYRDLGAKEATGGLVDAHVNARGKPFDKDAVSKRHFHDVKFQMVYVLKGWNRAWFEGHGEHLMVEGSCWIQPAGIKHMVLEYSDDLELLEIIIPAIYDTVELEAPNSEGKAGVRDALSANGPALIPSMRSHRGYNGNVGVR